MRMLGMNGNVLQRLLALSRACNIALSSNFLPFSSLHGLRSDLHRAQSATGVPGTSGDLLTGNTPSATADLGNMAGPMATVAHT